MFHEEINKLSLLNKAVAFQYYIPQHIVTQPTGLDFDNSAIIANISPQMSTFELEFNLTTIDDNEVEAFESFTVEVGFLQPMNVSLASGSTPSVTVMLTDDDGETCNQSLHRFTSEIKSV